LFIIKDIDLSFIKKFLKINVVDPYDIEFYYKQDIGASQVETFLNIGVKNPYTIKDYIDKKISLEIAEKYAKKQRLDEYGCNY
jgi:hypothetical protein